MRFVRRGNACTPLAAELLRAAKQQAAAQVQRRVQPQNVENKTSAPSTKGGPIHRCNLTQLLG